VLFDAGAAGAIEHPLKLIQRLESFAPIRGSTSPCLLACSAASQQLGANCEADLCINHNSLFDAAA